jgi:hypothetical protein
MLALQRQSLCDPSLEEREGQCMETVPEDKLDTLMAELRVIEIWDPAAEKNPGGDLERVGLAARRMRRSEIISELILHTNGLKHLPGHSPPDESTYTHF